MEIPKGALTAFFDERDDQESMIVGGFYTPRTALLDLDSLVVSIKKHYNIPAYAPIKWNLKDNSCIEARAAISDKVDEFRKYLFKELHNIELRIIISHVWKGSSDYTEDSWRWAFENILQRLCLILDKKRSELKSSYFYPFLDVVFDYLPRGKNIDKYFNVYSDAYYKGYSFRKNRIPSLKSCKACPCLLITSTRFSPALQVADILLGCVGDYFKWLFTNDKYQSVINYFVPIFDLFHCDVDGSVLGKGLIVNRNIRKKVLNSLSDLGINQ